MKPLRFVGASYDELCAFPRDVYRDVGRALMIAQLGEKAVNAKPLRGFGGAAVLEIVEDYHGDTYRPYTRSNWRAPFTSCIAFRRRACAEVRCRVTIRL